MEIPVKICGLTRAEDALLAAELGAAAIGFVFYPRSLRYIDASAAARIGARLPLPVARVGVFVDPEPETMIETARLAHLTHIQLHGDESLALCRHSPLPVIKAIRTLDDLRKYDNFPMAAFLIDSKSQKQFGGTGQRSDWSLCQHARKHAPAILAGGISAHNLAQAIASAKPDALDLSSSVESAAGVKDHHKLREFFAALRKIDPETNTKDGMQNGFFFLP